MEFKIKNEQYFDIKGNLVDLTMERKPMTAIDGNVKYIFNDNDLSINGKLEEITFNLGEVAEGGSDSSVVARDEVVKKKVKYTPAHLKAQNKYREKNRDKYNEAQRQLYEKKIQEEEWKQHYLERSRVNNRKYRDKKKEALIESGDYVESKRGRPRKIKEEVVLETKDIKDE
jgi:hypothetical protein